jgi:hypothetical protein
MKDISYHILDIAQNSINAGAERIEISLEENHSGHLELKISDNGKGMSDEVLRQVTDPFFTSSLNKKVGLGLPLLKQNAEMTGGTFQIASEENKGTTVTAVFNCHHIDMIPFGDLSMTLKTLIACNPGRDFIFRLLKDDRGFNVDTAEIRDNLDGVPLNTPEVLEYIGTFIRENLKMMKTGQH